MRLVALFVALIVAQKAFQKDAQPDTVGHHSHSEKEWGANSFNREDSLKLMHIVATPRAHESNTLRVSNAFIECMRAKYDDLDVDVIDLFQGDLTAVAGGNIETKYTLMLGQPIDKRHQESWKQIETLIGHFLSADVYLISTPMWNLGIPYALKYYIDAIIQPGYLFKYNEHGQVVGLVQGRKMVCITSRGGDYSEQSAFRAFDFQEPYLRAIFGFVGLTELHFINAQPMDVTPDLRQAAVKTAIEEAHRLVAQSEWGPLRRVANLGITPRRQPASAPTAPSAARRFESGVAIGGT